MTKFRLILSLFEANLVFGLYSEQTVCISNSGECKVSLRQRLVEIYGPSVWTQQKLWF